MTNSTNEKIRLRLYYNSRSSDNYPWYVQEKGVFFWHTLKKCSTENQAMEEMRHLAGRRLRRESGVVSEYNEQDYLADLLKREEIRNRFEPEPQNGANAESSVSYSSKDARIGSSKKSSYINKL